MKATLLRRVGWAGFTNVAGNTWGNTNVSWGENLKAVLTRRLPQNQGSFWKGPSSHLWLCSESSLEPDIKERGGSELDTAGLFFSRSHACVLALTGGDLHLDRAPQLSFVIGPFWWHPSAAVQHKFYRPKVCFSTNAGLSMKGLFTSVCETNNKMQRLWWFSYKCDAFKRIQMLINRWKSFRIILWFRISCFYFVASLSAFVRGHWFTGGKSLRQKISKNVKKCIRVCSDKMNIIFLMRIQERCFCYWAYPHWYKCVYEIIKTNCSLQHDHTVESALL